MVSVALTWKHYTNLNLTIDILMLLQHKPQQPSVEIILPMHIHIPHIIILIQQGLHKVSLMLSWGYCHHVNTTLVWARSAHQNRCLHNISFLNWTIMLYAHSENTKLTLTFSSYVAIEVLSWLIWFLSDLLMFTSCLLLYLDFILDRIRYVFPLRDTGVTVFWFSVLNGNFLVCFGRSKRRCKIFLMLGDAIFK